MKRVSLLITRISFSLFMLVAVLCHPAQAQQFETKGREAILIDAETGSILFEKNADQRMPTSSMSKVLTAIVVYDALNNGQLKPDDTLPVSEKAWRMSDPKVGGSTMFLSLGERVRVEDLLHGVVIQSGNDACIVLAEGLAGSEEAFVDKMNRKAQEIGMTNSHFMNSSGWPDPDHYSTARDLAKLGLYLIQTYPDQYPNYSIKNYTYGKSLKGQDITQGNRNPLLYANIGADGIKTGHAKEAGYGLIGSAVQNGRRLIMVINGLASMKERQEESVKLLDWGFREFTTLSLFKAGKEIDQVPVWLGQEKSVPLVVAKDVKVTLPRRTAQQLKIVSVVDQPVPAPVHKDQQLGKLIITWPEQTTPLEVPLVAGADIDRLGPLQRIGAAINYLLLGH